MKIFPAVHYSMGGLWVDYERIGRWRPATRLASQPADQYPGPVRHRRVRLSVSRRKSARGQFAAELHLQRPDRRAEHRIATEIAKRRRRPNCLQRSSNGRQASSKQNMMRDANSSAGRGSTSSRGGENPYRIHQELGVVMTRAATVVRYNNDAARSLRLGSRTARPPAPLLAFRHRKLDKPKRRLHQSPARHVPVSENNSTRRPAAR